MVDRRTWLQRAAAAATLLGTYGAASASGTAGASDAQAAATGATAGAATDTAPPVTARLARYAREISLADYPADVRHQGARTLLNWLGCAIGGSHDAAVVHAAAALTPFAGPPQAQLLGRTERVDALTAALINGIAGHVLDYDDTHLKTIIHPAASVVPALLALAQHQRVSGAQFLNALLIGVETECRIGNAVYPSHYELGWHITGTCGVFGAAAACGRLLDLSQEQMVWALGLAASQPVGLKIQFGTDTKSFHPGRAAQGGLLAALLAQQGFTAAAASLEGRDGWGQALSRAHDWSQITAGLGTHFESALNTYKPFACGIVTHPAIDAAIQLRNAYALGEPVGERSIRSIQLQANPLVLSLTGKHSPQSGLDGKFSIYHCIAAAIVFGAAGVHQFTDAAVRDPRVIALRDRVSVQTDPAVSTEQCTLTIALADGRRLSRHIEHAIGSLERPMSDAQLEGKFRDLGRDVLPEAQQTRLLQLCWQVGELSDAGAIAHAAAAATPGKTQQT
ncbi:MAG TPA: MmgE/PrpD family protein [Steroidobacteraceae bacterium]|nr:MmgE/PrpD family protein [Steroidobacteraceae bacterium]